MEIEEMLEGIHRSVSEIMPQTANSLKPGLNNDNIREKIGALPLDLPDDFYKLYRWKNGSDLFEDCFFPYYSFLPLERAVEAYFKFRGQKYSQWVETWFPFFVFNGRQWLFVNTKSNVIYRYHTDALGIQIEFDDLKSMISYYLDAYDRGIFYINEYGGLTCTEEEDEDF
jgi:hypothetical protein